MKLSHIFRNRVAAGVPPGGLDVGISSALEYSSTGLGGRMPPSTAGGTPAATAAFTMIEIAIALGVIGFALVAIIGILPAGMSVQKDNREETLVNFDGTYLMNAIRTGAQGQDDLTNYIISITNYYTLSTNGVPIGGTLSNWFTQTGFFVAGNAQSYNVLTNGSNIVGLLSIPKYTAAGGGNYFSNYTTADFRAITGAAVDQGNGPASREFAFSYRIACEIIPCASYAFAADPSWINYTAPGLATNLSASASPAASTLQNDLNQIRLRFRWPVLSGGALGNGRQVFRASASGTIVSNVVPVGGGSLTNCYILPQIL